METKYPSGILLLLHCIQLALTRQGIGLRVQDVLAGLLVILFSVVLLPLRGGGGVHVDGTQPPGGAVVPQYAV